MLELGNKIRKLRKEHGLTQEQFAAALSISPQAVSKWEMGGGYPDMSMIPILANYFEVTLDELFDFDVTKKAQKIEDILSEAGKYFWSDFDKAAQIYSEGIKQFPSADILKSELLSLYTSHIRSFERTDLIEHAQEMARRFVVELKDIFAVCSTKEALISLYLQQNKYEDAKAVVETLPDMYPYMLNDKMRCSAYHLNGVDRLKGAKEWKVIETQELFIACAQEGIGYYETGEYEKALLSFKEATDVIERFMIKKETGYTYPIPGTEANHMCYYMRIAGCYLKLNNKKECENAFKKAEIILIDGLKERDKQHCTEFLNTFKRYFDANGLDIIIPFKDWLVQNNIEKYSKD